MVNLNNMRFTNLLVKKDYFVNLMKELEGFFENET